MTVKIDFKNINATKTNEPKIISEEEFEQMVAQLDKCTMEKGVTIKDIDNQGGVVNTEVYSAEIFPEVVLEQVHYNVELANKIIARVNSGKEWITAEENSLRTKYAPKLAIDQETTVEELLEERLLPDADQDKMLADFKEEFFKKKLAAKSN